MLDSVGNEITLGATVRYGAISRPKEGRVVKIVQCIRKFPVKEDLIGSLSSGWRIEDRAFSTIFIEGKKFGGPSRIALKPENVLVVNEPRPAH